MLCVYSITPHGCTCKTWASLTEEQRVIFRLERKLKKELFFFFAWKGPSHCGDKSYSNNSEAGSGFWRIPQVMYCIRSACISLQAISWKLLSLSLFSYSAGRKNSSHGFAEFFEENIKEIFKHGSSKLEETSWSDGSSLSFACVRTWVFSMAQTLAPYSSLLRKYLIHLIQRDRGRRWVHEGS